MYAYSEIRRIHLEMTTRCNAACPMCSRNERGGFEIAKLPPAELTLDTVKRVLPETFVRQLEQIWLCGNYGDPIIARDTLEVLRYFKTANPRIRLGMNTNGSARKPPWWRELASVVTYCHFGIDGLADTNHLYRRRTHWNVIMENAEAFIAGGGAAHWEFIVFKHNEHQIEAAQQLASTMGFRKFRIRKTGRFFFGGGLQDSLGVRNRHGAEQYRIEPPVSEMLRNSSSAELGKVTRSTGGYADYLDTTEITCKAQRDKEIYVSAEGLVFPCCYLASIYRGSGRKQDAQFGKMLKQYGGTPSIDGKSIGVPEIIAGPLFQTAVPNSWAKDSVADGRLATCSSTCGAASPTKGQYTASLI